MARRELLALTLAGVALVLSSANGCGEFLGFGDDDTLPGASGSTDASADGAPDGADAGGRRCDPNAVWGTPARIDELSTADGQEATVTLSADERTIYMQRDVSGIPTILVGTRGDREASFGALVPLADIETGEREEQPGLSRDERTLFFRRSGDIMRATRDANDGPFSNVVTFVATPDSEGNPNVGASDLWYNGEKPNSFFGLFVRSLVATDPADLAQSKYVALPMADGNDAFHDIAPVLDESELTLYFASGRDTAAFSIYVARRTSRDAPFSTPVRVEELSSEASDTPSWLSADGCRMYLTSTRQGPTLDVYVAKRSP